MRTSGIPVFRSVSQNDFKTAEAAILQNEQPSVSAQSVISAALTAATGPAAVAFVPKTSSVVMTLEGSGSAQTLADAIMGGLVNRNFKLDVMPLAGQTGRSLQWQVGTKPATMPQAVYDAIKALVDPVRPTYTAGSLVTAIARVLADAKDANTYDADKAIVAAGQADGGLISVSGATDAANVVAVGAMAALDDYAEVEFPAPATVADPTALPFEGGVVGE